jgi:hypothetical protein
LPKSPPAPSSPRWIIPLGTVLATIFLVGTFSGEIFDPDFWWHLKSGQYILQQHRLPLPDPFSYTTTGAKPGYPGEEQTRQFNLTHEWLAQAGMYLVYAVGGFPALVLLRALMVAGACFLTGALAARRSGSSWWGIAAALAAATVATMFATDRPTLISFLLVMVFLAIWEWRRYMWLLPLLAIIWANCHGGFFLAWIICGAYCVEALIRRTADARRLLLLSVLTFLASGVNPNGFGIVATLLRYNRESYLTSSNLEWRHADLWGMPYGYDILLYLCVPVLAMAWRRVRPADWILFVFFAAASLTAFRNEIYFALFAPILIAGYFPWKMRLPVAAQYTATAALGIAVVWGVARGDFFQLRAGEWRYPAGAVAFLQSHRITTPVFNTHFLGGYLIWKGIRVFIDGRALSEEVYKDYRIVVDSPPGTEARKEILDRYGVGAIVMDSYLYFTGDIYPLNLAMVYPNMAEWKLVYEDPQSMVFLRNVPPDVPVIGRERVSEHLESACRLLVDHDPRYPGCGRSLGLLVRHTNPARARRAFAMYFDHGGNDREARGAYEELINR